MAYSTYSIIPYFVISTLLCLLVWGVLKVSVFYQTLCYSDNKSRFESIDGLRGFLALSVFFHHAVISQHYFQTGQWALDKGEFYPFMAHVGVCNFFMITGFLFWNKVIRSQGVLTTHNFYWSRINRLLPMYFVSIALVVLLSLAEHNFAVSVQPVLLSKSILSWAAFGVLGSPSINNVASKIINAGVTWTLAYEWLFYLALPLMTLFWRGWHFFGLIAVIYGYSACVGDELTVIRFFAYGMVSAYLRNKFTMKVWFSRTLFSLLAAVALAIAFIIFHTQSSSGSFALFIFFMIIASGNSMFGLFTNAAAKVLGQISYSLYLLHGIVLFIVLHALNPFFPIAQLEPLAFWFTVFFCGIIAVIVSLITYRFIEHPFLKQH